MKVYYHLAIRVTRLTRGKFVDLLTDLLALLLFVFLTLFITWPLIKFAREFVVGWVGDNYYFGWLIAWYQKSIFELHRLPLSVPFLNYPEGWNIAYNDMTPAMVAIALPASLVAGSTFGYNFSLWVSFVLSGFGVYAWVKRLTRHPAASMVAGTIFAFAPYRMSHLFGHFNLMGTQWFPLYFLFLTDLLASKDKSWKSACLAAIFLGLIGFTSQYYLYMTLVISVCYAGFYLVFFDHKLLKNPGFWKNLAVFLILSFLSVYLSVMPYLQLYGQEDIPARSLKEVRIWSANPTDFILPSREHFLWGSWFENIFGRNLWIENSLYVGCITLVLAVLAFFRRKQIEGLNPVIKLLVLMSFLSFLLALGTDLHWFGNPVRIDLPNFLRKWNPPPRSMIHLPGFYLFKFLPFYNRMRIWMRYGVFTLLFLSVLAGIGATWLMKYVKPRLTGLVTLVLLVLVVIDFYPRTPLLSKVTGRPVDYWLRDQPGEGAVTQFPLWQVTVPEQAYYTQVYNKPFMGSFSAFPPPQLQRVAPILNSFPDRESLALLQDLGVQWVIMDSATYPDFESIETGIEALDLKPVAIFDSLYVYEIK